MSEFVGHVDLRDRPLANISIPGHDDSILALIDTGFNGYVLMHEDVVTRLGFIRRATTITVELAGHLVGRFPIADGRLLWFGQVREVPVIVSTEESPRAISADEPIALIGTALLLPHRLLVDFTTRRVVIAQADD